MGFIEFLTYANMSFLTFLLVEIVITIIFTKDWKFRLKRIKGYPNLRPHSKTWKITWVFLVILFLLVPILISLFYLFLPAILTNLGYIQIAILFFVAPLVYLWAKLRIINKKGLSWWDSIPISISVGSLLIFILIFFK